MGKSKKILGLLLSASLLSLATVVYATQVDTDGGTWNYGYNRGINAYSEFYSGQSVHGAKVVNRNNGAMDAVNASSGVWAKASIWDIWEPASFYHNPYSTYNGARWAG